MKSKDLPEPAWWKRARMLKKHGLSCRQIAEQLGKNKSSVSWALRPEHYAAKKRTLYKRDATPRDRSGTDWIRYKQRKAARETWRQENYCRPLESYYRSFECL